MLRSLSHPSFLHFHIFYICPVCSLYWNGFICYAFRVLMSANQISEISLDGHFWLLVPVAWGKNVPPRGAIMFLMHKNVCILSNSDKVIHIKWLRILTKQKHGLKKLVQSFCCHIEYLNLLLWTNLWIFVRSQWKPMQEDSLVFWLIFIKTIQHKQIGLLQANE